LKELERVWSKTNRSLVYLYPLSPWNNRFFIVIIEWIVVNLLKTKNYLKLEHNLHQQMLSWTQGKWFQLLSANASANAWDLCANSLYHKEEEQTSWRTIFLKICHYPSISSQYLKLHLLRILKPQKTVDHSFEELKKKVHNMNFLSVLQRSPIVQKRKRIFLISNNAPPSHRIRSFNECMYIKCWTQMIEPRYQASP